MKKYLKISIGILILALLVILTIYIAPFVYKLKDEQNKQQFIDYISNFGFWGYMVLISFNALQVIIAILPGEIFEIISGVMYGPWLGLLAVELGITLASLLVISIMRGMKLNHSNFKHKLEEKKIFKLISNSKQLEIIIFFITIIPCLPKDLLVYIIPFTNLKLSRFLIINAIARIPSIISSTYFGSSLLHGHYKVAIILFVSQALVGLLGLIFNKQILNLLDKKNKKINKDA